ncbi:MAG: UvrD-helicase domain-containing protein [bacterium]|nr:UvrD-helicase domain-containing protein [bacterium]
MLDTLLDELNEHQRAAVVHEGGPAMVLAGAGSGKTRVLTTRVAWLMHEKEVDPSQILLVTFTNKAAQEMNTRVMSLTGSKLPFSGTFHRICATILRREGYFLGLSPGFVIYDSDDQITLIKQIYKKHGWSVKDYNPQAVKAVISKAKNDMTGWEEYGKLATGAFQEHTAKVFKLYQLALREQQAVDFDDLMLLTVELFMSHKEVLARYQDQIEHVLVDEYQDTNKVQYQLTKLLAKPQNNVYVVGDFAQSIYAWRGADYRNLQNLKKEFSDVTEYRLEQNYRSTQSILDAATAVISQTNDFPILQLWTKNTVRDKLMLIEAESSNEEADKIIRAIAKERRFRPYSEMAILYRTNAQSRPFEEALVKSGIPYKLVGGFKFYERKEIKDVLSYLRLVINPSDSVSRERVQKLGKRVYQVFAQWAQDLLPTSNPSLLDEPSPDKQIALQPLELLKEVLRITGYLDRYDKHDEEEQSRIENVQELLNVAAQFTDVNVFLENIALVQDDHMADLAKDEQADVLTLMSLHSAKGLEYPVVFMVGMEDGLLPHSRSLLDKAQMEEERRLCYVGITRAREKLFFSYARVRWQYGTSTYALRSRFLKDVPPELLEEEAGGAGSNSYGSAAWIPNKGKFAPSSRSGRHLVVDDDMLESVLSGEIDIKSFLDD